VQLLVNPSIQQEHLKVLSRDTGEVLHEEATIDGSVSPKTEMLS
jgi:hypothetical protein